VKFAASQLKHPDRRTSSPSQPRKNAAVVGAHASRDPGESSRRFDFSYSGIKTAVLRYVELNSMKPSIEARRVALQQTAQPKLEDYLAHCDQRALDLIASFQRSIVDDLIEKTLAAAREYSVATLLVTGGVAANNELRQSFDREASREGLTVHFPSRRLSTDNAAMIAAAAYPKFLAKDFAAMDFSAEAGMALR
jgi:N6-L-threonylcarbamoyladenine synthase